MANSGVMDPQLGKVVGELEKRREVEPSFDGTVVNRPTPPSGSPVHACRWYQSSF
jgi:hypothetical protein